MDIVYIRQLRADTVIGVYDWERTVHQSVYLDLEMATDIRKAAGVDALEHTLDYAAISARVVSFIEQSEFELIEAMAEQVAAIVREEFQVPWLRLRLSKPGAVAQAKDVGVLIERGEKPDG
ncbi:MAG: dihydroneopterin aldolase [Halioglobus sp.]